MNRRGFLKFLGMATVGSTVAYSFPSIIVPKNLEVVSDLETINLVTKRELYPALIQDFWFQETPLLSYIRTHMKESNEEVINPLRGELGFRFSERMVFRG